jgi:hypothetical protein
MLSAECVARRLHLALSFALPAQARQLTAYPNATVAKVSFSFEDAPMRWSFRFNFFHAAPRAIYKEAGLPDLRFRT